MGFKLNQRVVNFTAGVGIVTAIQKGDDKPVVVQYLRSGNTYKYFEDGRACRTDDHPKIFPEGTTFKVIPPMPKKGDLVYVWNSHEDEKHLRVFEKMVDNEVAVREGITEDGETSVYQIFDNFELAN